MDTLHIKIGAEINEELKYLAKIKGMTVSELIRQAIFTCYQLDLLGLSNHQKQALEAYKGGFISLGKLSELMGYSLLDMRQWLQDHRIPQRNAFSEEDVETAR